MSKYTKKVFSSVILFVLPLQYFIPINKLYAVEGEVLYTGVNTNLSGDDEYAGPFNIGFDFDFYETTYTEAFININGTLNFDSGYDRYSNTTLPNAEPGAAVMPFWDDIITDEFSAETIYYQTIGEVGSRMFIAQWTNMYLYSDPNIPVGTFMAILYEGTNEIQVQYRDLFGGDRAAGSSATVGLNKDGTTAITYSYNTVALTQEQAIRFTPDGAGGYTVDDSADYELVYLLPDNVPAGPTLVNPTNGITNVTLRPTFEWLTANLATSYRILISTVSNFSSTVVNQAGLTETNYTLGSDLDTSTTYYWRVEAINEYGSSFSSTRTFTTAATANQPPDIPSSVGPATYFSGTTVNVSTLENVPITMTLDDPDPGNLVRYRIQFSTDNGFSTPVIDYRSTFMEPGIRTFKVGENGGTYLIGDASTELVDSEEYYIRIRAEDDGSASSDWTESTDVAFVYSNVQPDNDNDTIPDETDPDDDQDGITDVIEDASFNSGDGNGDGTKDSLQSNVTSIPNPMTPGKSTTLEVSNGCSISTYEIIDASVDVADGDYEYPLGMNDFTVDCEVAGSTATITVYYTEVYDTSDWVIRKYIDGEYITIENATIGTATIDSTEVTTTTYEIIDGGDLDADKLANGTIEDPAGPAVLSVQTLGTPDTGFKTRTDHSFISLFLGLALLAIGVSLTNVKANNKKF